MTNTIFVIMVKLTLSKEELDVIYYALKRYSLEEREVADRWKILAGTNDFENPKFVAGRLKESAIADKLCDDCIKLMLNMLVI